MRLRVLGCHGGESPSHRATSFMLNNNLLLDAGAVARGLAVEEQCEIDYVILSHSHLDHIRDLALLADNVIGTRKKPLDIYCTDGTASAIEQHFFNNIIWPDFTKIPNPADPEKRATVRIHRVKPGEMFVLDGLTIWLIPVNHPVECHAIFVKSPTGTFVYSGDTGPTEQLWDELNRLSDLTGFIYEVSFPNEMPQLAAVSGHLTPLMMAEELKKFRPQTRAPIFIYHLKPNYFETLKRQIAELNDNRLRILIPMDEFEV